jgi:pimeloyl-ACP methyl ester carboxylesterase
VWWRRLGVLVAVLVVSVASGCAGYSAGAAETRSGLVDIGNGRKLFLDCQGHGSPTVFIIPGLGSYAEAWNVVVPPDDPIRSSPYDIIGEAKLAPSPDAVQPTVARTTRVCSYDRPGTRFDGADRSTPVAQPHTIQQDVDDIVMLLCTAQLAGPFVVAAHSYGGLIADLLARTRPDLVAGLVFVDPTSEFLPSLGSPAQNAAFDRALQDGGSDGAEGVKVGEAFATVKIAPPLPQVPAIVLSSDKFAPPQVLTPENYTLALIHQANDRLAAELHTTNVIATGSGHNMMLYQPKFVADNIIDVVERVRS